MELPADNTKIDKRVDNKNESGARPSECKEKMKRAGKTQDGRFSPDQIIFLSISLWGVALAGRRGVGGRRTEV